MNDRSHIVAMVPEALLPRKSLRSLCAHVTPRRLCSGRAQLPVPFRGGRDHTDMYMLSICVVFKYNYF
jgi:hypothetical protein